jgi:hypothetical protein
MRLGTFQLVALLLTLALVGCQSSGPGGARTLPPLQNDIDVTGEREDSFGLDGIRTVVLRCYCPRRNIRQEPMEPGLMLRARGRLRSQGYFGPKDPDPEGALHTALRFEARREDSILYLEHPGSWRHMHHSMAVSEVWLSLPADRQLVLEPARLANRTE